MMERTGTAFILCRFRGEYTTHITVHDIVGVFGSIKLLQEAYSQYRSVWMYPKTSEHVVGVLSKLDSDKAEYFVIIRNMTLDDKSIQPITTDEFWTKFYVESGFAADMGRYGVPVTAVE